MAKRPIQIGEHLTIRIPRNANPQVITYLNEYREHHTLGFGEHLLFLVQKGIEAEGLPSRQSQVRTRNRNAIQRNVVPFEQSTQYIPVASSQVSSPDTTRKSPKTDLTTFIDLSNFE